jgi:glycosyltransferase involved in cell wall biosynthesis
LRRAAERAGYEVVPLGRRIGSDVWHLHLANTYDRQALRLLTAARACSTRLLITEHLPRTNASDATLAERRPRRGAPSAKGAYKRAQFILADQVIAVSAGSGRFLRSRYRLAEHKLAIIPHGVAPREQAPTSLESESRFVVAASLITQKGLGDLIIAADLAGDDWFVDVFGDGAHRAELERQAADVRSRDGRPRVNFRGWSDEIDLALASAFGLIVASRWEASSYAALDAMAAGLPVVATRVDGVEDIVAHNETGLLVAPANPLALGRQIDELLRDRARARAFGLAGRARVAREFSLERMISRTLAAYGVASVERESTPTR